MNAVTRSARPSGFLRETHPARCQALFNDIQIMKHIRLFEEHTEHFELDLLDINKIKDPDEKRKAIDNYGKDIVRSLQNMLNLA